MPAQCLANMRDSYKYSLHTDIEEDKGMDQDPGQ